MSIYLLPIKILVSFNVTICMQINNNSKVNATPMENSRVHLIRLLLSLLEPIIWNI